eukprot:TRINITY_DN16786_c0_g1_i3.p1 TRINITY_DN16786_c0_g1~~TRINITY_DN16786_c0_g1_i3.p1  ORF type:complete len:381 (-),score=67.85 TRINITY_DN16786_c0_g1_i3:113-1219(-)
MAPKNSNGAASNSANALPSMASVEYWDDMYEDRQRTYDTLYGFDDVWPQIERFWQPLSELPPARTRVLHPGCGTSDVTEGLWRKGFREICNLDFSPVVIDLMARRWESIAADVDREGKTADAEARRGGVSWREADVTDLSIFAGGSYELVLEKFTLDALLCETKGDVTDPRGVAAVREFHRVLGPGGLLVSVAWGDRIPLLQGGGLFEVERQRLTGDAAQRPFLYFCRKRSPAIGRTPSAVGATASVAGAAAAQGPAAEEKKEASAETISRVSGDLLEIWIRVPQMVSAASVDVEVASRCVRWRLNDAEAWRETEFADGATVDVARAVARWSKRACPQSARSDLGRSLLVTAPASRRRWNLPYDCNTM